ncbi:hypothetical protein [Burkholderia dolosa]|uniref:hypothetical protein n=1 Tax=Burkholderia dolosa TaxID=152500 RepID=UPI0026562D07|nr:hypothetical protein [Burkholderia dolosa]MDN7419554.1 hypothetical protein [Burkholderia dolosa]
MTTDKSRADALRVLDELSKWVSGYTTWQDEPKGPYLEDIISDARRILAACPVEQPAAAPVDAAAEEMRDAAMRTVQAMGLVYTPGSDRWRPNEAHAPALTVAAALEAYEKASIAASECEDVGDARVAFVRSIIASAPVEQPAAVPIPYDGLTEEFTDEVARLADDAPGIREAVSAALENCNAIIAPQRNAAPAQPDAREGLTDERIAHIAAAHTNSVVEFDRLLKFARALLQGADHAE